MACMASALVDYEWTNVSNYLGFHFVPASLLFFSISCIWVSTSIVESMSVVLLPWLRLLVVGHGLKINQRSASFPQRQSFWTPGKKFAILYQKKNGNMFQWVIHAYGEIYLMWRRLFWKTRFSEWLHTRQRSIKYVRPKI